MAACSMLKLLVTASHDDLSVFSLPDLTCIRTIGGVEPMKFGFYTDGGTSGWMAFVGSTASARHLIVHGEHVGYVAAPGMLSKPRGEAARGSKVAVSKYAELRLYEGAGATWTLTHAVRHAGSPFGLRFTADGTGLAVTDFCYGRVSVFFLRGGFVFCAPPGHWPVQPG